MHEFSELIRHSTRITLNALNSTQREVIDELQSSARTPLIKTHRIVQLQRAISAIGMFSMFDAMLQEELQCTDGFRKATELLDAADEFELKERFVNLQLAVNVLKHGRGRSYDVLVKKVNLLPFRVKLPNEAFFCEGDVSEVATLVEVDDVFVQLCADVIHEVSLAITSSK